jgi:HlyD family secretion protein
VPIEVRVDLMLDPNSPDGYKWSSPNGAVIAIPSGTLCSADVVIDRQRPIELMLPIRR